MGGIGELYLIAGMVSAIAFLNTVSKRLTLVFQSLPPSKLQGWGHLISTYKSRPRWPEAVRIPESTTQHMGSASSFPLHPCALVIGSCLISRIGTQIIPEVLSLWSALLLWSCTDQHQSHRQLLTTWNMASDIEEGTLTHLDFKTGTWFNYWKTMFGRRIYTVNCKFFYVKM